MAHELEKYVVSCISDGIPFRTVAAEINMSGAWVHKVWNSWLKEGEKGFEKKSKRPKTSPNSTSQEVIDIVLSTHDDLKRNGLDSGHDSVIAHLGNTVELPSRSTVYRILKRNNRVKSEPHKKPSHLWVRFESEMPNETWQTDVTHWKLKDRTNVEILDVLDDNSRLLISIKARKTTTSQCVVEDFQSAYEYWGQPASVLSDNGFIFTMRLHRDARRNAFENHLKKNGIIQKNSTPYHPQTCGKIERFHQTLKKYLSSRPSVKTIEQLQRQLDKFQKIYNEQRPHRSKNNQAPLIAWQAMPKARPGKPLPKSEYRLRKDKVANGGTVSLRFHGRMLHLGIGRKWEGTRVVIRCNNGSTDSHGVISPQLSQALAS